MPGFLKANLSEAQAQDLSKFKEKTVAKITSANPRLDYTDCRQFCCMLHSLQGKLLSVNNLRIFWPLESWGRHTTGVQGASTIVAMFSPNSEESRRIFRYNGGHGSYVQILKLTLEGQLSRGGSSLNNKGAVGALDRAQ